MPSFSIAGSGSVSLNSLDNATEAVVDNVNITMQPTSNVNGDISVTARDTLYAGAYSGAAALQWKKGGSAIIHLLVFPEQLALMILITLLKQLLKTALSVMQAR